MVSWASRGTIAGAGAPSALSLVASRSFSLLLPSAAPDVYNLQVAATRAKQIGARASTGSPSRKEVGETKVTRRVITEGATLAGPAAAPPKQVTGTSMVA